jgi:DNA-binding NarL/FixJ family response regulator
MNNYHFLIADDHFVVRTGLKTLLLKEYPKAIIQEVTNGEEVLTSIRKSKFDLLILDFKMPHTDPFTLISNLRQIESDIRILVFSAYPEKLLAKRILKLGALGYIEKHRQDSEVMKAVKEVLKNKKYLSDEMAKSIIDETLSNKSDNIFDALSDREMEIMLLLLSGKSNQEIQTTMNLHSSTIATYKNRLFQKLGVNNLVSLIHVANNYNLI